jgi:hypothetical protein
MNPQTPHRTARFQYLLDRFSKLNEAGRHCFIGRIIDGADANPVLLQEISQVLQRLETDAGLARCWHSGSGMEATATASIAA